MDDEVAEDGMINEMALTPAFVGLRKSPPSTLTKAGVDPLVFDHPALGKRKVPRRLLMPLGSGVEDVFSR